MEVTARDDLLALVASTPKGGATMAGDPRVTLAIGDRDSLLGWVRYGYRSQFDGRSREARGRCIPNPADLALVLDVAAAAVRWYEAIGVQETARAALAEADAIERLTPGARALLRGLQTGPGRPSSGGVALGDGDGLERGEDG